MKASRSQAVTALVPWLLAALVWSAVVVPLRAEQSERLAEQSRIRRDRLKADRAAREASVLRLRVEKALAGACRASVDPAEIRQRAVAASSGLSLAPFSLSVSGPPSAGATVDADGPRSAVLTFVRRLGSISGGGFLRSVGLRDRGLAWGVSATTGVIEPANISLPSPLPACAGSVVRAVEEPSGAPNAPKAARSPQRPLLPRPSPDPTPLFGEPLPTPTPMAPFTLVAFVTSEGRVRVSVRASGEVRVVSPGDVVSGWRCVSIDTDDGAVFVDASGRRVVLKSR